MDYDEKIILLLDKMQSQLAPILVNIHKEARKIQNLCPKLDAYNLPCEDKMRSGSLYANAWEKNLVVHLRVNTSHGSALSVDFSRQCFLTGIFRQGCFALTSLIQKGKMSTAIP